VNLRLLSFSLITLVTVCYLAGCGGGEEKKDHVFTIEEGVLYRGKDQWTIRSIQSPFVAAPGTPYEVIAQTIHRIAEVGGNTICIDLLGISPDGSSVQAEAVQAVASVVHEATERHMGAICRVFIPSMPAEGGFRIMAARTVAKTFANRPQLVYLIDGPSAKEAAEEFHKTAPNLIVASPAAGVIQVVTSEVVLGAPVTKTGIQLFSGSLPANLTAYPHFVVPDSPDIYAKVDAALADPIENQPWTPDNSILTEQERAEGWIALFDGKTLNGWTMTGTNKNGWKVKEGVIEWAEDKGGLLRSRDRYENFILKLDWKIDAGGNSGVMLRAPRTGRASRIGMETQIEGDFGEPPTNDSTGAIYVQVPPLAAAQKPNGEWNTYEITLNGPTLQVVLNGTIVQALNLDSLPEMALRLKRGFIALQDHHNHVCFRNVKLKKL
jgi:hypothetical protein